MATGGIGRTATGGIGRTATGGIGRSVGRQYRNPSLYCLPGGAPSSSSGGGGGEVEFRAFSPLNLVKITSPQRRSWRYPWRSWRWSWRWSLYCLPGGASSSSSGAETAPSFLKGGGG